MPSERYRIQLLRLAILAVFALSASSPLYAADKKKIRSIPCPKVIADKKTGQFGSNTSRYTCFNDTSTAKKAGFVTTKAFALKNLSGWYRLKLGKSIKDTCSHTNIGAGTLFLQVRDNSDGVFGEFCPQIGRYSGTRTEGGFLLSGTEILDSTSDAAICGGGAVERYETVELSKVVNDTPFFTANYSVIFRCLNTQAAGSACTKQYTGVAFYETHPIWPPAAEDISTFPMGCGQALTKCVDCHDILKQ